jgi:hypothetical protein
MHEDLTWACENQELQQKYSGQLVIIHRKEVLASGSDESELLNSVASQEHPREELVVVEMLAADFEAPPDMNPTVDE